MIFYDIKINVFYDIKVNVMNVYYFLKSSIEKDGESASR